MKITYFFLLSILFTSVGMSNNYEISKAEQAVNHILATTAEKIENDYPLKTCGEGASMPRGNIKELSLAFNTKKTMSKEELRNLLVKTSIILVNNINSNSDVQEKLTVRPFSQKNIQIIIYNHDKTGRGSYDPNILTSEISSGVLTYRKVKSESDYTTTNETIETYEEALKFVNTKN